VNSLAEDASGNLWFGNESTVVRWNGSSSRTFSPQALGGNQADGVVAIAGAPDGSVWLGFAVRGPGVGLQKVVNDVLKPFVTPELDSSTLIVNALFLDRQNNLWIGTEKRGIYRIHDRMVDHYGSADGLSSDFVAAFYEDHEGDLWVATSRGIDCFRDLRVTSVTGREGLPMEEVDSVLASRDGTVWAGGPENLASIKGGNVSWIQSRKVLPGNQVTSLFEDYAGRLWVGVDNSLFIYEKGAFRPIRRRDGSSIGFVTDLAEDGHHNVWAEVVGPPRRLVRITNLMVQEEFSEPQMPAARKVAVGPDGSIWRGLLSGDLARYKGRNVDIFRFKNSSSPSLETMVNTVSVASDDAVLGATSFGLIAWKAGKQQILTVKNGLPCNVIYSLITDNNGSLWLYTQCGIVEIQNVELQKWWADPNRALQVQTVGAIDGAQPGRVPFQGAARSTDGKLWFANYSGLQVIDPAKLKVNSIRAPTHIEDVIADHKTYKAGNNVSLPPNTGDLQIDYAA
jgi:ligand-binding sensor domain-containing protein